MEIKLYFKESSCPEEEMVLFEGMNAEQKGAVRPFAFFLKNNQNNVLGGIKGLSYFGCLYIDFLWIDPEHRKRHWGTTLMHEAEKLGKKWECAFASMTTMDQKTLPFYEKHGYALEYTRDGFKEDQKLYILRKKL
jgi:GNAT superfamily N-acetyltransferase